MVRVRHFEFLCRPQGLEPSIAHFRVFYQLIRNMGFYSFALRNVKNILITPPPKSFHNWKTMFFFIWEEVMPIAMVFRPPGEIEKEDTPIPKKEAWYDNLMPTPNRVFVEQVLIAAGMSGKWPARSKEVLVLLFNGEEQALYQSAFKTFGGSMGVKPLESSEPYWYKRIKDNFLYPLAGSFASAPTAIEGVHLPKPRPLRGVTSAGKEILYLSGEESVGSSNEELSSWFKNFAGMLHDLGIDPEEKTKKVTAKKKALTRKKVSVDTGATSKKAGGSHATAAVPEKGEKKKSNEDASKSSGNARSRAPESGVTPSSFHEEEEEEEVEEEGAQQVTRKRSREGDHCWGYSIGAKSCCNPADKKTG
ncbi:hypothetical protein HanOQP8_Chr10g0365121 [Helianthus annuus]|nr:hypothetical protein HanOQP8_Chr10g0365121 [Helianthus annuus]KAJ0883706.1 hypothetical protein HanPSC8_Chr10g0424781 [Helianthus annuus]